jgi:molecular chaperone GrpE (heat shock protein)
MLDPFSALSAASAVVQLVDFGSKLVAGTIEIYQSTQGLNEDHIILEKVSSDMRDISDNLERNLQVPSSGRLSRDEAALLRLAKDCIPLAKQLLDILSDLRVKSDSIRIVESFRQSFRSALKKGKIHDLEARLDKLRNEVNTRMLAILR